MLDVAQKYTDQLKSLYADIVYDDKYKFVNSGWVDEYKPSDTTWSTHEFVSLNSKSEVIGHIVYEINRNTYSVCGLTVINFSDDKMTFGKDLSKIIKDIFLKFNFRKLSFGVYIGNPIEKSYDKMILKYGGRIVGVKKEETKLMDGKFYDFKMYEVLRNDFIKYINK